MSPQGAVAYAQPHAYALSGRLGGLFGPFRVGGMVRFFRWLSVVMLRVGGENGELIYLFESARSIKTNPTFHCR
jgi:hypothetical protein